MIGKQANEGKATEERLKRNANALKARSKKRPAAVPPAGHFFTASSDHSPIRANVQVF
jgi:hypothetical protein